MKINKIKHPLSNSFINSLEHLAAGYLSPDDFDKLLITLNAEIEKQYFDSNSEANFLRILSNRMDKTLFLSDLIKYTNFVEILVCISAYSNYLTDILVRNPEYFYLVSNPSALNKMLTLENLSEDIRNTIVNFNSIKGKVNALKGIKRREILRIGLKDIILKKDLLEITAELSFLAKAIAAELFEICYNEVLQKYKIQKINRKYAIVGLGKLGGSELNYSSDIDLILFYDQNSSHNSKEYFEIMAETVQLFIEKASLATESGFLYRVDFRLRPDGRNSPLCKAMQDYLIYYETRGEDWERQMLIKADFIGGDRELYSKFIKYLTPFIYPSYFKSSPLEQIRRMKENIEKRVRGEENIKLSKGGIRDIEFSLQALQLLNGHHNNELKTGNSLIAIQALLKHKLLSEDEASVFKEAYIFFRRIEHFLQLLNDAQVHTIPQEGNKLEALCRFMGFGNEKAFRKTLDEYKTEVIKIYNSITNSNDEADTDEEPLKEVKTLVNYDKALKNLNFLREGKGLLDKKTFDSKAIESFAVIEPMLINYLANSTEPDLVLQNFCHIIKPESIPAIWYKQLENNVYFQAFLRILEYSHKTVDRLITDPTCKEAFITRRAFRNLEDINLEEVSPVYISFILSLHFTIGLIGVKEIFFYFKQYFNIKIKNETENAIKKYKGKYFIAALGSFGAGEMSFASDIDLIFFSTEKMDNIKTQAAFENLLKKLKESCLPFDIDCRLKPEGQNSPLVWNLENYSAYLQKRAKVWEFQSMCKARFIAGDAGLFDSFKLLINNRLAQFEAQFIKKEVLDMRKMLYPKVSLTTDTFNIKKSNGGIADIEFIIQYIILTNPDLFIKYSGNNIEYIIDSITSEGVELEEKEVLLENFMFLKKLELSLQNIYNTSQLSIAKEKFGYQKLAGFMNFDTQGELLKRLDEIKKMNFKLFEKYLKQV